MINRMLVLVAAFAATTTLGLAQAHATPDVVETVTYGTDWSGIHKSKSDFGIDVDFESGVKAEHNETMGSYAALAFATGLAETELFGTDVELGYVNLYADSGASSNTAGYSVRIAGVTVASDSASTSFSKDLGSLTIAGAGGSAKFSVAGISLKASAEAGGTLGVNLSGTVGNQQASVTLTPTFTVGAAVSASINNALFKCGIEGDLTLVEVSAPATGTMTYKGGTSFQLSFDLGIDWEVLSGKLKAYVKEKIGGNKTSTTIFSFDGWSGGEDLVTTSTTISM